MMQELKHAPIIAPNGNGLSHGSVSQESPPMNDSAEIMVALEALMRRAVDSDIDVLREASTHILDAGGKRIRPRLTLLTYAALGGLNVEEVLPVAAAVELIHTASVVHDDINDHGVVRRGRPSVNSIWGRTFALLTGDFLFTKVYELMAPYRDLNVLVAEAASALVEGETLQAAAVKDNNLSRAVYYDIIGRKTAALFRAAAVLGGRLANATPEQEEALGNYGYNVGLAFQIVDDVLDLTASEEQLGKTSGIDVEQGRGFAVAHAEADTESSDPMVAIRKKVLQGDAVQEAYDQANTLVVMAIEQLSALPNTDAKQEMIDLAESVVHRSF